MQPHQKQPSSDSPCLPTEQAVADARWMRLALELAGQAAADGEVPVGAVLTSGSELLASAGNSPIRLSDPTAHAEILALRAASSRAGNYRLTGTTLYVTLEPCIMCMGAILHARVERLVFGALDPKTGAVISRYRIGSDGLLNHQIVITAGVLAEECAALLRDFFRVRRGSNQSP